MSSNANPQSLNRYSYVTNNPLKYTDPTGHMRVEEAGGSHGSVNCSKYSQYCNNGKPKSKGELKGMYDKVQQEKRSKTAVTFTPLLFATVTPIPTSTSSTTNLMSNFPAQCTSSPCIGNFVPSATSTPQATAMPLPQAMSTVVAGASDIFNTVCIPGLSGTQGCGAVIDQQAQGLGAFNPLPPGAGTTIDAILAGASGANEIANNVHISEPSGQGYINSGIYLGVAEVTSLFPLLIFAVLP